MDLMLNILLGISWILSLGFVFQMGVAKGYSSAYQQINASLQKGVNFLECVFIKKGKENVRSSVLGSADTIN